MIDEVEQAFGISLHHEQLRPMIGYLSLRAKQIFKRGKDKSQRSAYFMHNISEELHLALI